MDIDGVYYCSKCMRRLDAEGACPHCGYDPEAEEENSHTLCEGTFLNDRYIFGAVIGSGGFGVTYAAWDVNLQTPVAVKEYFPGHLAWRNAEESDEIVPNPADRAAFRIGLDRFKREAQILAQLRNIPGVVNVYESFEDNGTCYIVMEYVRGVPLDTYVQENRPDAKALLAMMRAPIHALEIIHKQGVSHRDITPRNMLVQADGSVKLIDFGAAREIGHETQLVTASDGYAPIEQYDMERQQGPWGDIYSLSATIYHMLTGVRPTSSLSRVKRDTLVPPKKLGVKLKRHQERALLLGLAIHPEKRVRSMDEFASILYNTPLPEEARRRRAFMRRVCAVMAGITAVFALIAANFACGFPLGKGLLYALHRDGWHVSGALRERAEVVIPEQVLFLPVTAIEPDVFAGNAALECVTVPGSVDTIEPYTFRGCTNLKVATLLDGVMEIEHYAFSGCAQLHTVNVPASLEWVGHSAFHDAWERVMLCVQGPVDVSFALRHDHVAYYERADYTYTPVEGGVELAQIHPILYGRIKVFDEYVVPSYIDGQKVVALAEDFAFPLSCKSVVLPAYLETARERILSGLDAPELIAVDLGESLREIPDRALCDQVLLTEEIKIPDTVQRIGDMAFYTVPLRRVELPQNLSEIGDEAFCYTQINKVNLPESLRRIGAYAFSNTALYSVDFPANLYEIGAGAFSCTNLSSVDLTIDLDGLGNGAFSYCDWLRGVNVRAVDRNPFVDPADNCNTLADECFAGNVLYDVSLMGDVKALGRECFAYGVELSFVSLPEGLEHIGERAFTECSMLNQIIIPDSVTYIDDTAFEGCSSDMKIIGSEGSYAQAYAEKHGFIFVPGLDVIKSQFENGEYDVSALPFFMPE